jgi:hypothetical protein
VIRFPERDSQKTDGASKSCPDGEIWRYHQRSTRGRDRNYVGHVTYIGGAEGQRLRGVLGAVARDLLAWAVTHRNAATDSDTPDERSDRGAA